MVQWLLDNSRIRQLADCQLADWTSRGLDISRTGQLADWTTRGCHRRLCVLSFPFWRHLRDRELSSPRLVQYASCLVREMSSPRVVQSASWQSESWRIRELSSYRSVSRLCSGCAEQPSGPDVNFFGSTVVTFSSRPITRCEFARRKIELSGVAKPGNLISATENWYSGGCRAVD